MKLSPFYLIPAVSILLLSSNSFELEKCGDGQMSGAWYGKGLDTEFRSNSAIPQEFLILVSRDSIAKNYISDDEDRYRRISDTSGLYLDPTTGEWKEISGYELEKRKEWRERYLDWAEQEHINNNANKHVVRMFNNTSDTVSFPIQDGSFICILEAQNELREWKPIEFWHFSWCGNSYWTKDIKPQMANSFVFDFPDEGDFSTLLRFKMLGSDKFYYSNEFRGEINHCEFFKDDDEFGDERFVSYLEEFENIGGMWRE